MINFKTSPKPKDAYYDRSLEQKAYDNNKRELALSAQNSINIEQKLLSQLSQTQTDTTGADNVYEDKTVSTDVNGKVTDLIQRRDVYVNKGNWYNN